MKTFEYTITDPLGIHARPAGMLAKAARNYGSECTISVNGRSAKLTQLIQLMSMGIKRGDRVTITADGADEDAALDEISRLMQKNL